MRVRLPVLAIGAAGTVVAVLALGTAVVQYSASTRWAAMEEWMAATREAWEGRNRERAVLWGDSVPGSAFEHYGVALAEAAKLRDDHDRLQVLWLRPDDLTKDERSALRERWAPGVAAVREGAHRSDALRPLDFKTGFQSRIPTLLDTRWLTNMAVVEARELLAAGRGREAVEVTLDAATFGLDYVHGPTTIGQMIGSALVAIATSEAWTDERLRQLDRESLELLASGLQRLDASLPATLRLDGEHLFQAHMLMSSEFWKDDPYGEIDSWRYGFSSRWMVADAVLRMDRMARRFEATAELRWPQRVLELERIDQELAENGNPITADSGNVWRVAHRSLYQVVSRVRMLRMAVDLRRGLDVEPLPDPLGAGPFRVTDNEGRIEIRGERDQKRDVAKPLPR